MLTGKHPTGTFAGTSATGATTGLTRPTAACSPDTSRSAVKPGSSPGAWIEAELVAGQFLERDRRLERYRVEESRQADPAVQPGPAGLLGRQISPHPPPAYPRCLPVSMHRPGQVS